MKGFYTKNGVTFKKTTPSPIREFVFDGCPFDELEFSHLYKGSAIIFKTPSFDVRITPQRNPIDNWERCVDGDIFYGDIRGWSVHIKSSKLFINSSTHYSADEGTSMLEDIYSNFNIFSTIAYTPCTKCKHFSCNCKSKK